MLIDFLAGKGEADAVEQLFRRGALVTCNGGKPLTRNRRHFERVLAYGSPEGAQQAEKSVLRRNPFRMIHHQNLDRVFLRLKLQPQLLLQSRE